LKNFLTKEEEKILKQEHKRCKTVKQADRIKTILCLNKGLSYEAISELLLLDDSTLRRYYKDYKNKGIYKLLSDNFKGGVTKLSKDELAELDNHLERNIYLTSRDVAAYVKEAYGVSYTINGITSLLHSLGYSYKKPKHVPGKANKEKQEEFIKKYNELKATKSEADKIYFMDGCHPQHNSQPAYGWIKKGTQKELKSNTGRQRVNLNGAYNIEDHELIIREDESINSQSTIELFKQISQRQKAGMIYIICDNARYYKSVLINQYLKTNKRIKLVFLPPYSPNLNIIERLWRFLKKKITYNRYIEKYIEFKEKVMGVFENIDKYKDELMTLMTENFQILDPKFSHS
jgi:transposase